MKLDVKNIEQETIGYVKNVLVEVEDINLKHTQKIAVDSIDFQDNMTIVNLLRKIRKSKYPIIYTITIDQAIERKRLLELFDDFREENRKKTRGVDRINISKFNKKNIDSEVLYVGSSTTNFHNRLKNHFGILQDRVYSLHLNKWSQNLIYKITLNTYEIESKTNKEKIFERAIVEIVEQQIWDRLKPIFGKKSGL